MLQKVAAKVDYVAADFGFLACEVRWILKKKYFAIAAISAAILCGTNSSYAMLSIYSIAVSSASEWFCAEDWRIWRWIRYINQAGWIEYQSLPACGVLRKKFSCAERNAEKQTCQSYTLSIGLV